MAGRSREREPSPPPAWLKKGVLVDYCSVIGQPPTKLGLRARTDPEQLYSGHWVIWLEGHAGAVACDAVVPQKLDVDAERNLISALIGDDPLALSEPYDFGAANTGRPNGAQVVDILTEPDGAPMFERCLPEHASFVTEAQVRWPRALAEIERLRELVKRACELATTHRAEDRVEILAIRQAAHCG